MKPILSGDSHAVSSSRLHTCPAFGAGHVRLAVEAVAAQTTRNGFIRTIGPVATDQFVDAFLSLFYKSLG